MSHSARNIPLFINRAHKTWDCKYFSVFFSASSASIRLRGLCGTSELFVLRRGVVTLARATASLLMSRSTNLVLWQTRRVSQKTKLVLWRIQKPSSWHKLRLQEVK